jgi:plastocyanin domain-containing protein
MKYFLIILVVAVLGIGGIFIIGNKKSNNSPSTPITSNGASNVQFAGNKQIITIEAKGGYNPKNTTVKADTPTELDIKTNGTVDCSSYVIIKDIDFKANLKPTGTEKISIKPQPKGTVIQGYCGMGMYSFQLLFS